MAEEQKDVLDGLEERLQSHSKAFESLLALTPARDYYGAQIEDGLDPDKQWNRKKQTKEEKRAAKKAKLDPANQKTALDVMKEREKKRKRELGMEDAESEAEKEVESQTNTKRQKKDELDPEVRRKQIAEKRKAKRQEKKAKLDAKVLKAKAKREAKLKQQSEEAQAVNGQANGGAEDDELDDDDDDDDEDNDDSEDDAVEISTADLADVDFSGLDGSDAGDERHDDIEAVHEHENEEASSAPTSPNVDSPAFDVATNVSEASSSSSIDPPPAVDDTKKPTPKQKSSKNNVKSVAKVNPALEPKTKAPTQITLPTFDPSTTNAEMPSGTSSPKIQLPNVDQAELQERLRKRIEELRAKRKADGIDGKPATSRQELLDQRRQKEERRKAHKKELRQKAKEEEARKREEQLRGSGSPAADIFSGRNSPRPRSPAENSFAFSRLAFEDGTSADAGLSTLKDAVKKKGPQDPKTALLAAQKKEARLAGLDPAKKADIAEKDMWLNAKKRAHGERIRDDTSLLKKALKRKEKAKGKSESEWTERKEAVVKGKELKQKKRETNLAKRREEKGSKGGKKKGGKPGGGKKKPRAGFEGRFKA